MDYSDIHHPSVFDRIVIYLKMIKFEHSVFALPFAYVGAFLARMKTPSIANLVWITVAMVGARTFAMSLNRIIDAHIDRSNPRTADRAIPKGLLSETDVWMFAFVSLAVFLLAVFNLAPITHYLWPLVIIPFVIYPYMKRFTWASHFVLGLSLGLAPIGAWTAITNSLNIIPFAIGLAVMLWTAGFDIIYACQDIDFDRAHNLYSIPAGFGVPAGLVITRILHVLSISIFIAVGVVLQLNVIYFSGVVLVAALLLYENSLVKPDDLSSLNTAFFTVNGVISVLMSVFVVASIIAQGRING
jgi:4-hydroxybenzoate polyprenyltransferase